MAHGRGGRGNSVALPEGIGSIEGEVIRGETMEPLSQSTIVLAMPSGNGGRGSVTALTDSKGHFTFTNIAPGPFNVTAEHDGYFGLGPLGQPNVKVQATGTLTS